MSAPSHTPEFLRQQRIYEVYQFYYQVRLLNSTPLPPLQWGLWHSTCAGLAPTIISKLIEAKPHTLSFRWTMLCCYLEISVQLSRPQVYELLSYAVRYEYANYFLPDELVIGDEAAEPYAIAGVAWSSDQWRTWRKHAPDPSTRVLLALRYHRLHQLLAKSTCPAS